jgi:hypothetical protein
MLVSYVAIQIVLNYADIESATTIENDDSSGDDDDSEESEEE